MISILALLLAATPAKLCLTKCGLVAVVSSRDACIELAIAERRVIDAYEVFARQNAEASCKALRGWLVYAVAPSAKDREVCKDGVAVETDKGAMCIAGYTSLDTRRVMILSEHYLVNAFTHEIGHVLLGRGHCDWEERGVKAAIRHVTGQPDESESDCD